MDCEVLIIPGKIRQKDILMIQRNLAVETILNEIRFASLFNLILFPTINRLRTIHTNENLHDEEYFYYLSANFWIYFNWEFFMFDESDERTNNTRG